MPIRKQNIPMRNSASEKSTNPLSSISTTNNGIVKESKGWVYMTLEFDNEEKRDKIYLKVLARDEYHNLVEVIKSSDRADVATSRYELDLSNVSEGVGTGEYMNNQSIRNIPYVRAGSRDGAPTRNIINDRVVR
tara:strand:+ start:333 stop:734 length:402 start_codon:yes stop_codon:yes gene_type:complete